MNNNGSHDPVIARLISRDKVQSRHPNSIRTTLVRRVLIIMRLNGSAAVDKSKGKGILACRTRQEFGLQMRVGLVSFRPPRRVGRVRFLNPVADLGSLQRFKIIGESDDLRNVSSEYPKYLYKEYLYKQRKLPWKGEKGCYANCLGDASERRTRLCC